jgi:undecaprenyl-diphosphatase
MTNVNESLAEWLFGLARFHPLLDAAIVFFARYFPYLLALAFLGFLLTEQGARRRLFLLCETALTLILSRGIFTEGIRFFFPAERPFEVWDVSPLVPEALGNSFPSGHAAILFVLMTILFFRSKGWGWWFLLFAAINGIARITAGVHWPLDIVGGALVGVGSTLFVHLLFKRARGALDIAMAAPPATRESTTIPPEREGGAA